MRHSDKIFWFAKFYTLKQIYAILLCKQDSNRANIELYIAKCILFYFDIFPLSHATHCRRHQMFT